MSMFKFFNNCIYHVCQQLYYSVVHTWYIHASGTDMSVHVYARWSGFQMNMQKLEKTSKIRKEIP